MNKSTEDYINQWIYKANEDILVVEKLTDNEIFAPSSACFHCQQAVEKFLKAFLIANEVEIKKTHNIEFLLSECGEIDSDFAAIEPKNLSDFGVDVRYPGDMYIPTDKETIQYKEIALSVKDLVERKFSENIATIFTFSPRQLPTLLQQAGRNCFYQSVGINCCN